MLYITLKHMHMSESVAGVKFMVSGGCVYDKTDILKLANI